jgi:hypothetical protein
VDDDCQQPSLRIHQDVSLAPGQLLGPVKAAHPTGLGFDRLAVDDRRTGRRVASGMQTFQLTQLSMNAQPGAV